MLSRLGRPVVKCVQKRQFSVKAVHSSFPATLICYSPWSRSSLLDHKQNEIQPDNIYDEGVIIAENGLVYPGVDHQSVSNGAIMLPNTFTLQEYVRRYYDDHLDRGGNVEMQHEPQIITVAKGTPIPSHLVLFNEAASRFSLQPSCGMSVQELNRHLDQFFDRYASKESPHKWLEKHPYDLAMADDKDDIWTKN